MSQNDKSPVVKIPVIFEGFDETPILFANQFIIQHQAEEFILTLAQLGPVPLVGTPEQQREQAGRLTHVRGRVIARVAMTRSRLEELIQILQRNLETFDGRQK